MHEAIEDTSLPSVNRPPSGSRNARTLANFSRNALSETGARRHTLGISIEGSEVSFYYCDRAGTVRSSRMHLVDDAVLVITALILIMSSDRTQLGFEPYIQPPRQVRDTLPVSSVQGCTMRLGDTRLVLDRVIHSAYTLHGPDTVYYAAQRRSDSDPTSSTEVMVKLSWRHVDAARASYAEASLFYDARKNRVEGVANLISDHLCGSLSTSGVRARLGPEASFEDRELQVLVFEEVGIPLYMVLDLDHFHSAMKSLVHSEWFDVHPPNVHLINLRCPAHSQLLDHCHLRHGNIGIDSVMVRASDPTKGLIVDFGAASVMPSRGTEPQCHPLALVRDDLKSFARLLSWMIGVTTSEHLEWEPEAQQLADRIIPKLPATQVDFRMWQARDLKLTCADPLWQRIRACDQQEAEDMDMDDGQAGDQPMAGLVTAEEFLRLLDDDSWFDD